MMQPASLLKALLFAAPPVIAAATILSVVHRPLFRALTGEDGLFEWAQVGLFAFAGAAAGLTAVRLRRGGHLRAASGLVVVAAGLLFAAGEEISWGQRLFGVETPALLERVNTQGETTVHNIGAAQDAFKLGTFLLSGAAVVACFRGGGRRRDIRTSGSRRPLLVPPLLALPAFAVMFGYRLLRYTVVGETWATVEAGEGAELCFALGVATVAVVAARRAALLTPAPPDESRFSEASPGGQAVAVPGPFERRSALAPEAR